MFAFFQNNSERLSIKGQTLSLSTPLVMGILNVTPDSFSDGGQFYHYDKAIEHARGMIQDGAAIIDIGGESTRPGSDAISTNEELRRVLPIIKTLRNDFPETLLSIDTTKFDVAQAALEQGVHFVNDISGLQKEPRFIDLCAESDAALIIMHSKGEPKVMQQNPVYDDVINELKTFFLEKIELCQAKLENKVVIDPGFGFGKTLEHNLSIAHHLSEFSYLGCPLMVGASRKSMIGSILGNKSAQERISGSLAFHYDCLTKGAKILRTHDVKPAIESILVYNAIKNQSI